MERPKIVSEDDPSSRLYSLALKVSQRKAPQGAPEVMTIGHLKEISALLAHEGENFDKYSDAFEELFTALYKLIQSGRHLLFPELVNIIALGFNKCPLSFNPCANELINHLLPVLNSVNPRMAEQADICITEITMKTPNLLVIPEIGKFHELNPLQRLRTARYMKNLISNYPLTELGNCPIDMVSIFNNFFQSSFLEPALEIKMIAIEALAIFKVRFPKTLHVSKEVLKEIKRLEKKVKFQRSPRQEIEALVSFTAAHKNNFSLQKAPLEIEGLSFIESFSYFGIDLESATSSNATLRRKEFENIFQKITNDAERNRVLEHSAQRNELFRTLICHIADPDFDVQFKALNCLQIVLCEPEYKLETNLIIEQLLEISDSQQLKSTIQSLMHLLLIKDFETQPHVFIKHSFSEKFRENFEELYEMMFDRLSQNKLTQITLLAEGGIKLILDQNKDKSDAFTLNILLLLVQFGISSRELEQLLELLNQEAYRSFLSKALMQSAQALTYLSPDQDKFIDKPSCFFLFANKSYVEFKLTEKANTIVFWFFPTLQMECVRFLDIRGKSNHLQVQLRELNLVISIDKKKAQILKNVVRIDCWNSFVLTFKSKSHFIGKKFECLMYCNNYFVKLSINDCYEFSSVEIGEKSPFMTENSKKNCFRGLLTTITHLEEFVSASKLNQLVVDCNDEYSFPKQSSYEKTLKLKQSSPFSHGCKQISPVDPYVNLCCKRVVTTSLAEAFKAIGGLGRLLKPLEESNNQIQILEVVVHISRSKHFHSLIFPHFFEYIGLIVSKTCNVPADYLLVIVQVLKKDNLSTHPALVVEIIEGILLNKDLWRRMDLDITKCYVETFKLSISAIENPSLMRLFNVFSSFIDPKKNYPSMVDLIMAVLLDDRNQKQFEDILMSLLNKLQNSPEFHQVYEHLLYELHNTGPKVSVSLKKKLATLLRNVDDENIELNLMRLIWPSNRYRAEIIDIIHFELKPNRLFFPTFEFLLANANESGNKPLLKIITSRLPHNLDVLPFLKEINSKKGSKLCQEIVCVIFPGWLSSIFIRNYPLINEITEQVFQVIANSLVFRENVKSKYVHKVSEFLVSIGKPDSVYACYHFFLNTISEELQINKILFLGLLGVLEDLLTRNNCYSIKSEMSRYSELLQRIFDLGMRSHLQYCSRPGTPELSLDVIRTGIKLNPQFSKNKVYLKEGGFIRLMLRFNLIGLYYEMNPDFVHNIEVLLGGDSLFSEMSTDKYTYNSPMWNSLTGFSSAFNLPEGKDLFFDPCWISIYILTESIEILVKHATPGSVYHELPLVKLLGKILKEINLFYSEHFKPSNITEEEIVAFNLLVASDCNFESTLVCRSEDMKNLIEQRKIELYSARVTQKFLLTDFASFEESISLCERNIDKIIRLLLDENDHFYIKRIHLFFLAKISGKLNLIYSMSQQVSQNKNPKTEVFVIKPEPTLNVRGDEDDYDLYSYFIRKSYERYLTIAQSVSNQEEITKLIQVRNIYDSMGRRFLLKPCQIKEDNFALERAVGFLTMDCEKIKVEGNYLGKLILTKRFLYFECTGSVSRVYKGTAPEHAHIKIKKSNIYHINEVLSVHPRRYLLQHTGIEVYLKSGRRIFFNLFTPEARQKFYNFAGSHWHKNIEIYTRRSIESRAESCSKQWQNGELSNFEYLMKLNDLSSRSGNDITQYPIFPCIIKDFLSDDFNLENLSFYRTFEYPIGAQTEAMREEAKMKFSMWSDSSMKTFHYGTHYSTEGVTTHYLFRLEPFTMRAKNLQGGKLDAGDRLFSSMARAWLSSQSQIGDVKELIPELFYMPEMFLSKGRGPFSHRQDGVPVDSLELPPWAHNYFDFIMKHMKALEFTHVKTSLKNWVDLIFGFKQFGEHAINALNVFYETSYEEYYSKDLERLDNEDIEKIVNFVFNFGQTPVRLFNKEHPRLLKVDTDMFAICLRENLIEMVPIGIKSVRRFWQVGKDIFAVSNTNSALYLTKVDFQRGTMMVNTSIKLERASISSFKAFSHLQQYCRKIELEAVMTPRREHYCIWQGSYLVSGGYLDSSFKLHKLDGKYMRSVFYHSTVVTAVASAGNFLFTGSLDGLIAGWNISQRNMIFYNAFVGHAGPISIIAPLVNHCLVASLASNGTVVVHEMRTGECLRVFKDKRFVGMFGSELGFFVGVSDNHVSCFNANGYEESFTPELNGSIKRAQIINDGEFVMISTNYDIVAVYKLFESIPLFQGSCGNSSDLLVSTNDERVCIYYSHGSLNKDSRRNSDVNNLIY